MAIIGILAGVGIPMYNGYMEKAKINASQANLDNLSTYLQTEVYKCNLGQEYTFILPGVQPWFMCSWNKGKKASNIAGTYLTKTLRPNYMNPHNKATYAIRFGYGTCPNDQLAGEIYADRLVTPNGDAVLLVSKLSNDAGSCPKGKWDQNGLQITESKNWAFKIIYMP